MSVFKLKNEANRSFKLAITQQIEDRISRVENRLKALDSTLEFPVQDELGSALDKLLSKAERDLKKMEEAAQASSGDFQQQKASTSENQAGENASNPS